MHSLHFFVTVGVSVFERSRCWKWKDINVAQRQTLQGMKYQEFLSQTWEDKTPGNASQPLYQYLEDQRANYLKQIPDDPIRKNDEVHLDLDIFNEYFDSDTWNAHRWRALPAEIATIYQLCKDEHIQMGDTITFLHGKDSKGKLAPPPCKQCRCP